MFNEGRSGGERGGERISTSTPRGLIEGRKLAFLLPAREGGGNLRSRRVGCGTRRKKDLGLKMRRGGERKGGKGGARNYAIK